MYATKVYDLEVAFEQLVNEEDQNCEYSQSTQEPHGLPEESNDYDCKNQQDQVLNTSLDRHELNMVRLPIKSFRPELQANEESCHP